MAFSKTNYILLAIGMAIVILGLVLMSGSGSDEGFFNPDIFSARRIKVAPLVSLFGFLFIMFAIMFNPKNSKKKEDERTSSTHIGSYTRTYGIPTRE